MVNKQNFTNTIKYLKKDEWDRLRSSIDNYRDKLIISILYSTSMRIGEFTKLNIQDIDFEGRFITIPAENTKTKTGRTVWIPQEVLNEIKAYLKLTKKKKGRLFDLTPRRVQQLLKNILKLQRFSYPSHIETHPYNPRLT